MATPLASVMAKCSNLTLLHIYNQHLFLQHNACIFFLHLVMRWIDMVIIQLKFTLNLIPIWIFALNFHSWLSYTIQSLLRSQMDPRYPFCFLVTVGSSCLYVLKWFLLGKGKIEVLLRHMSLGTPQGVATSEALVVSVCLMSILQAGDWARVSTPAGCHFSIYITTTDWDRDYIQHTAIYLSEWSSCLYMSNMG